VLGTGGAQAGRHPDVRRHPQDLFETLTLVEALGEAEAGAGDGRQALAPAEQLPGRHGGVHRAEATPRPRSPRCRWSRRAGPPTGPRPRWRAPTDTAPGGPQWAMAVNADCRH